MTEERLASGELIITRECRRGIFSFLETDTFVGRAINDYGEYGENEIEVFKQVLREGDVAMDVGANIGSLTVPMAQLVGTTGHVYAWEPGANNLTVLQRNIEQNGLSDRVTIMPCGASNSDGDVAVQQVASLHLWRRPEPQFLPLGDTVKVPVRTIDSLKLPKLKFLKIDIDGMELECIEGMDETIKRCRPYIYIENEQQGKMDKVIAALTERGYRLWWHRPPQFNPDNWRKNPRNWFGNIVSMMMVCYPEEGIISDETGVDGLEEVADLRNDDDMYEREIWRYRRYLNRWSGDKWAALFLAHNLNLMQRREEAQEVINDCVRQFPEWMPIRSLQAMLNLQAGDFSQGWPGAQLRFEQPGLRQFGGHRFKPFNARAPIWDGQQLKSDQPLLIWSEQGFGDMIMFARFLPLVHRLCSNVYLECHDALYELFEYSHLAEPGHLRRLHRRLPDFAYQISLPSVPHALKITEAEIRRWGAMPYLDADDEITKHWKEQIGIRGMRIGVCHRGSPRSERPYTRDMPGEQFDKLMFDYGPFFPLYQNGQFENFADTAASLKCLDLVLTVDTSIAHLAGAMGVPVWLLLSWDPDWRWGTKDDTSIWYPSMRIFRQKKFRDWSGVIDDVQQALVQRQRSTSKEAAE